MRANKPEILILIAGLILAASLPLMGSERQRGGESGGEVSGLVLSASSGELLKGALVWLRFWREGSDKKSPVISTVSGPVGRFRFLNLPSGDYELWVSKSGYRARARSRRTVTLDKDQSVARLTVKLWPAAVISGRVLDPEGGPLHGARVEAHRIRYRTNGRFLETAGSSTTNDLGDYRVFDLPAGEYIVRAVMKATQSPPGIILYEYGEQFYPNASGPLEAASLNLDWGQEAAEVDFQLFPAPETAVAVAVVDGVSGQACANCPVRFVPRDSQLTGGAHRARTRKDGALLWQGLHPGPYQVTSVSPGIQPKAAAAEVHVGNEKVAEVSLKLMPGVRVSGSVVGHGDDEDSIDLQAVEKLTVYLTPEPGNALRMVQAGKVDPQSGAFVIEDVPPGSYRVKVAPLPPNGYLQGMAVARRNLAEPRITISGEQLTSLQLKLAADAATVRGTVRPPGETQDTLPTGIVVLAPAKVPAGYLIETHVTYGSRGDFRISGIPPGSYYIFAAAEHTVPELSHPAVRAKFQKFTTEVHLKPRQNVTLDLTLIPETGLIY